MADNNYTLKTMKNGNGKRNRQKKTHFTKCFLKPASKSERGKRGGKRELGRP